jgi:hypothetical protein
MEKGNAPAMSTHTLHGHALESLRDVGQRIPAAVPVDWSDVEWPDDLVARVADDLAEGFGTVKTVVTPAAVVAAGAGVKAASSTRKFAQRHPVALVAGLAAVVALVIWMRRRRTASSNPGIIDGPAQRVSQVA